MADVSHIAGLIVGGAHPSPFPYAHIVTFTTHKTLRGPRGAIIIARADMIDSINKALFPGMQGGPHLHTIAGIGVALEEALKPSFKPMQTNGPKMPKLLAGGLKTWLRSSLAARTIISHARGSASAGDDRRRSGKSPRKAWTRRQQKLHSPRSRKTWN